MKTLKNFIGGEKLADIKKPGKTPDYKGTITDLDGNVTHRIALWKYEPKKEL